MPEIFEDGGMFEYREAYNKRHGKDHCDMVSRWIREDVHTMLGQDEINNRFGFHKATIEGPNATQPQHAELRGAFRDFAAYLDNLLWDSREKALAMTALEEASMWSHKAIAKDAPLISE